MPASSSSAARQRHRDRGAGPLLALGADQPTVAAHDALAQGEPEPGPLVGVLHRRGAAERLEDGRLLALGDADPGVDDVEADPTAVAAGEAADGDRGALPRKG